MSTSSRIWYVTAVGLVGLCLMLAFSALKPPLEKEEEVLGSVLEEPFRNAAAPIYRLAASIAGEARVNAYLLRTFRQKPRERRLLDRIAERAEKIRRRNVSVIRREGSGAAFESIR